MLHQQMLKVSSDICTKGHFYQSASGMQSVCCNAAAELPHTISQLSICLSWAQRSKWLCWSCMGYFHCPKGFWSLVAKLWQLWCLILTNPMEICVSVISIRILLNVQHACLHSCQLSLIKKFISSSRVLIGGILNHPAGSMSTYLKQLSFLWLG